VEAFRRSVASGLPRVGVCTEPFHERYRDYLAPHSFPAAPAPPPADARGAADPPPAPADGEAEAEAAASAGALEERLVELCRTVLGQAPVALTDKLVDVGADSLDVLQIQSTIEKALGVRMFAAPLMVQTLEQLAAACRDPERHPATLEVLDAERLHPFLAPAGEGP
jgi:acyl carrier protein